MIRLNHEQTTMLKEWFLPERPGPLIGSHIINTGHGACFADRWPQPRVLVVEAGGNYTLLGDARHVTAQTLKSVVRGFVECGPRFEPLLREAYPDMQPWPRIVFAQAEPPPPVTPQGYTLRLLHAADAAHIQNMDFSLSWIGNTWGGHEGLAASGYAWGALVDDRLVAIACTFFVGSQYEEIGVVTEPHFQRRGFSTACAAMLCRDIWARGHRPSWTTSTDNVASMRVAQKLGFSRQRDDVLYVAGIFIPTP